MKAILTIEMPKSCLECPLEMDVTDTSGEKWKGNICRGCGKRNSDQCEKPDWCPLVPMPEKRMCNCIQEMIGRITEEGFENVEAPVDLLSGRLYLTFTGNKKGQKKHRKIPVLLSKCPICGEEY